MYSPVSSATFILIRSQPPIHFFITFEGTQIPYGYYTENIYGFVEELVVEDDPEYQWIEKIRTPRASNEARQAMFFKMSGEVQRKIGLKAIELGGNAIIGYVTFGSKHSPFFELFLLILYHWFLVIDNSSTWRVRLVALWFVASEQRSN